MTLHCLRNFVFAGLVVGWVSKYDKVRQDSPRLGRLGLIITGELKNANPQSCRLYCCFFLCFIIYLWFSVWRSHSQSRQKRFRVTRCL